MDETTTTTPTKLFLETSLPTSASPYPSPSSAFYPPPIPANHEFANKLGGVGAGLVGNKRYRGSVGSAGGLGAGSAGGGLGTGSAGGGLGTGSAGGLGSPTSGNNGLGPSSANSSRRGSASAPSPLATHPPHVAQHQQQQQHQQLDGTVGSPSTGEDSTASHDRIIGVEGEEVGGIDVNPNPIIDASNQNENETAIESPLPNAPSNASNSANPSTPTPPNPTSSTIPTTPISTIPTTPISTTPNPIAPASTPAPVTPAPVTPTPATPAPAPPTSKRTSQILESLTPIRAAPPSPGPSRRGSLIRRGSSRRWSRGSGAKGVSGASGGAGSASGGDSIGTNALAGGGIGGMAGIGSAWFGGDTTGGTSSTVSEDGSLHSNSGEPGSNTPASNAALASKRASRRLSAFAALASTAEGEVVSFNDLVAKEDEGGYLSPSALSPEVVESKTEPVTPATPADDGTQSKTEMQTAQTTTSAEAQSKTEAAQTESGFSPLKPILVADFAFPSDDARHSKRPLELLSRVERDALSPEEREAYSKEKGKDEWEEAAEEDGEDQWGWIGVMGLKPLRREGGGGGGYDEEEEEEEMTPRFGYGYGYSSQQAGEASTPTSGDPSRGVHDSTNGAGGGEGSGEFDPDSPLPPGIYRALYAFEAEGTAEMSLSEGQLVRVVGRGGGVGWAVVERGWRPENSGSAVPGEGGGDGARGSDVEGDLGGIERDEKNAALDAGLGSGEESSGALGLAGQALVPEGYLEIWMLDGEEWGARDVDDF